MSNHRAWRVAIDSVGDAGRHCIAATEIQFYWNGTGERLTVGNPGVPIAGDYGFDLLPAYAFDNNFDSMWHSSCGAQTNYIGWDSGADPNNWFDCNSFAYVARFGGDYAANDSMKTGGLEWSDDLVTWFRVFSIEPQTGWTNRERRLFGTLAPAATAKVFGAAILALVNEAPPQAGGAKASQIAMVSLSREYEIPKKPDGRLVRAIWGNPLYIEKG